MWAWSAVPIVAVAAVVLLRLGTWAARRSSLGAADPSGGVVAVGSRVSAIRHHLFYQPVSAAVAIIVLGAVIVFWGDGGYLTAGDFAAPARGLRLLGVGPGETWFDVGVSFAVIATIVTTVVVWLQVPSGQRPGLRRLMQVAPWALSIAVVNSAVEEAIFRVAPVIALEGVVSAGVIAIISAVLFGLPHWFGHPGGLPGTLMAGFLGWLMCQAMLQTHGIVWAWGMHALQDVVILAILFASPQVVSDRHADSSPTTTPIGDQSHDSLHTP